MRISVATSAYKNQLDYCSEGHVSFPPPRSIEERVGLITQLLEKTILCRHAIEEANHLYRELDVLERKISPLPKLNSGHLLEVIANKVKRIMDEGSISAKNLIFLYHLQSFSDQELPIRQCFEKKHLGFNRRFQEMAFYLPCCKSTALFDQDVNALIGSNNIDAETLKILNEKKETLKNYEAKEHRKESLAKLRQTSPNQYPGYFDQLLERGYFRLFDHLVVIRSDAKPDQISDIIKGLPFSDLSHIVLETRKAIIEQVSSLIPSGMSSLIPSGNRNVLFLLGSTRSGKSTTLCFLRGDNMSLTPSRTYESTNDQNGLIEHQRTTSCTFLPSIEVVNELVIVDFPGFDDTHGQWISLGMECALKALVTKYSPKILVLEAITNNEAGYATVRKVGERLGRLFDDKQQCMLGITKYSKDHDFLDLKRIEEEQKRQLNEPSQEEQTLHIQIQTLKNLQLPALQPQIDDLQKKLVNLEQKRQKQALSELPETEEKARHRKVLQDKENELLTRMGLGRIIRFSDLEEPSQLELCLKDLEQGQQIVTANGQSLDPQDKDLIEKRFDLNLKNQIQSEEGFYNVFASIKEFEKKVLESSLIKTILSLSKPEVGEFLHLPEMDSKIVREFDKQIVKISIEKYVKSIVENLNIKLSDILIEKMSHKASKEKAKQLKETKLRLQTYILNLLNFLPATPTQVALKWKELEKQYQSAEIHAKENVEKKFELASWAKTFLAIPWGVLLLIRHWNMKQEIASATREIIDPYFDSYIKSLEEIHQSLIKLKGIEKTIQKQEEINEVFYSLRLDMSSTHTFKKSIQTRIDLIKKIYGDLDWEIRVVHLADRIERSLPQLINKSQLLSPAKSIAYLLTLIERSPEIDIIHINANYVQAISFLELAKVDLHKNTLLVQSNDKMAKSPPKTILLKQYDDREIRLSIEEIKRVVNFDRQLDLAIAKAGTTLIEKITRSIGANPSVSSFIFGDPINQAIAKAPDMVTAIAHAIAIAISDGINSEIAHIVTPEIVSAISHAIVCAKRRAIEMNAGNLDKTIIFDIAAAIEELGNDPSIRDKVAAVLQAEAEAEARTACKLENARRDHIVRAVSMVASIALAGGVNHMLRSVMPGSPLSHSGTLGAMKETLQTAGKGLFSNRLSVEAVLQDLSTSLLISSGLDLKTTFGAIAIHLVITSHVDRYLNTKPVPPVSPYELNRATNFHKFSPILVTTKASYENNDIFKSLINKCHHQKIEISVVNGLSLRQKKMKIDPGEVLVHIEENIFEARQILISSLQDALEMDIETPLAKVLLDAAILKIEKGEKIDQFYSKEIEASPLTDLYTNNLKNWEFGQEAPQNSDPIRGSVFIDPAPGLDQNFEEKPTPPKTNSSGCLCIAPFEYQHPDIAIQLDINGVSYHEAIKTKGDGACAIHALLGNDVIDGERTYISKGKTDNIQENAKRLFLDAFKQARATACHTQLLIDCLHDYFNQDLRNRSRYEEKLNRFDSNCRVNEKTEALTSFYSEIFSRYSRGILPMLKQGTHWPDLSDEEISNELHGNPQKCFSVFESVREEILQYLNPNLKQQLQVLVKEKEDALQRVGKMKENWLLDLVQCAEYYDAVLLPGYFLTDKELELSAYLFTKKVILCSNRESDRMFNPEGSDSELVVIYHQGFHYSRLDKMSALAHIPQ